MLKKIYKSVELKQKRQGKQKMETKDALTYIIPTVVSYSKNAKVKVANRLIENGKVTKRKSEKDKLLYVGSHRPEDRIEYILTKNNNFMKEIENWEFDKNYKFSMLFGISESVDIDQVICEDINKGLIIEYDTYGENLYEDLYVIAQKPSLRKSEDEILLKFNFKLEVTDISGNLKKEKKSCVSLYK